MSVIERPPAPVVTPEPSEPQRGRPAIMRSLAEGELVALRVLLMLAVIWAIFAIQNDRFLSPENLTNLTLQIASIGLISVGVVLVLLLGEPKVELLDEPTAALGVPQTRQVLDLIRRLKDRGLGVVVITHNMADVFEVADRVVVLYLGRNNGDFRISDVTREDVVAAITGLRTNGKAVA
jgi:hypothetical protein